MSLLSWMLWMSERMQRHPLDRVLSDAERKELVEYFDDLLATGHTPREAMAGVEKVWAEHV